MRNPNFFLQSNPYKIKSRGGGCPKNSFSHAIARGSKSLILSVSSCVSHYCLTPSVSNPKCELMCVSLFSLPEIQRHKNQQTVQVAMKVYYNPKLQAGRLLCPSG